MFDSGGSCAARSGASSQLRHQKSATGRSPKVRREELRRLPERRIDLGRIQRARPRDVGGADPLLGQPQQVELQPAEPVERPAPGHRQPAVAAEPEGPEARPVHPYLLAQLAQGALGDAGRHAPSAVPRSQVGGGDDQGQQRQHALPQRVGRPGRSPSSGPRRAGREPAQPGAGQIGQPVDLGDQWPSSRAPAARRPSSPPDHRVGRPDAVSRSASRPGASSLRRIRHPTTVRVRGPARAPVAECRSERSAARSAEPPDPVLGGVQAVHRGRLGQLSG